MEALFLKLLNMSITAGWLVLAVVVLRFALKKAPKYIRVILWSLVGVRLICPFSVESVLSLIPSAETVPPEILYTEAPQINSGISILNSTVNPIISDSLAPSVGESVNPMQIITFIASVIWVAGIIAMLAYSLVSYLRIHQKVREATPLKENIWVCDRIDTPFILGIFRPKIFLPSSMSEADSEYVIAHEKAHLRRRDHIWKPLGFALLAVYWFNPILWLAYILLCRDIELACDEKVINEMGEGNKKSYLEALINCSVPRRMIAACPVAFGEVGVKSRIKTVLNYKKPAFWIIAVAIITCIAVAVCFLTNPYDKKLKMEEHYWQFTNIQSEENGGDIVYCSVDQAENYPSAKVINLSFTQKDGYFLIGTSSPSGGESAAINYKINNRTPQSTIYDLSYADTLEGFAVVGKTEYADGSSSYTLIVQIGGYNIYFTDVGYYTDEELLRMVDEIADNKEPSLSSNPYDYIEAKRDVFDKILSGKSYTVECFVRELRNAETFGLDKYIMAAACSEITGIGLKGEEFDPENSWSTAEEWLSLYEHSLTDGKNASSLVVKDSGSEVENVFISLKSYDLFSDEPYIEVEWINKRENEVVFGESFDIQYYENNEWKSCRLGQLWFHDLGYQLSPNSSTTHTYSVDKFDLTKEGRYRLTVNEVPGKMWIEFELSKKAVTAENLKYSVSYANYSNDAKLFTMSLNFDKMMISSVEHLPIFKLESKAELDRFKTDFGGVLTMTQGWDEIPSFNEVTADYTDEFFNENTLFVVYVSATGSSKRFGVNQIYNDGQNFYINVTETTNNKYEDMAMSGWFITVEAKKSSVESCTVFDAALYSETVSTEPTDTSSGSVSSTYSENTN